MLISAGRGPGPAIAASLVLGALIASANVWAKDEAEAVSLEYQASPTCPTEADFVRLVREKTNKFRLSPTVPGLRSFRVTIEGDHPSRGELSIVGGQVSEAHRAVDGETCEEVVSALALATALAIDPPSLTPPEQGASPSAALPPAESAPPTHPPISLPAPDASPTGQPPSRWTWGLGAYGTAAWGVAPNPLMGGGLVLQLFDRPRHPELACRLNVELTGSEHVQVAEAEVGFSRALARLAVCPLTYSTTAADMMVCGHAAAGMFRARSQGVQDSHTDVGFWSSGGASVLLKVNLGGQLSLVVDGGLDVPFRRDRYFLQPDQEVHRVPAVGEFATIGVVGTWQ